MGIDGRRIAITGGAGGMGRAIAKAAAERGARVFLLDLAPDVGEVATAHGGVGGIVADITDPTSALHSVVAAVDALGGLDVLVNGAGWDRPGLFASSTPAEWQRIVAINYLGVLAVTQCALPALREAGDGAIVASRAAIMSGRRCRAASAARSSALPKASSSAEP